MLLLSLPLLYNYIMSFLTIRIMWLRLKYIDLVDDKLPFFTVSWSVGCFSIWKISLFTIFGFFEPYLYYYRKTINDEAILNKVDDDDFDALLAAADRLNSQCNYKKCKSLVKTLGTNCAHCNLRWKIWCHRYLDKIFVVLSFRIKYSCIFLINDPIVYCTQPLSINYAVVM